MVEAVLEDLNVKQSLFENLDEIFKQGAILATSTSCLPVIECAAVTTRRQDVVGMHFFNPAQIMKLVEVVHTVSTADDVVATVQDLCRAIGKHPVTCGDGRASSSMRCSFLISTTRSRCSRRTTPVPTTSTPP